MITRERLEELIKTKTPIYYYKKGCNGIEKCIVEKIVKNLENEFFYYEWIIKNDFCLSSMIDLLDLNKLYETEKAFEEDSPELYFKSKYYTEKVVKFEPPTWEEFCVNQSVNRWYFCERCFVEYVKYSGIYINETKYNDTLGQRTMNFKDTKRDYYKALDYAKKIFLCGKWYEKSRQ